MGQLKQIVGAMLADITQARVISDVYYRNLGPLYQEDPVLKLLSVPRTDIKEVTLTLKFAVLDEVPVKNPDRKNDPTAPMTLKEFEEIEAINVDIVTSRLANLPETLISSISITFDLSDR